MPAVTDLPIWTEDGFEIRTQGTVDTTAATYTYNGSLQSYIFRNDGAGSITLTIGGTAVTVVSGEMVAGGALSSFTVQASSETASWTMRAFESRLDNSANSSGNAAALVTLQNAATGTGNGTQLDVANYATIVLNLVFTGTATVIVEGSVDGTNWDAINGYGLVSGFININNSTFSSNNRARFYVAGLKFFRARISAFTSGTVTVQAECTSASMPIPENTANSNADALATGYQTVNVNKMYGFNGTTWDRIRTSGTGTNAGILRVLPFNNGGNSPDIATISADTFAAGGSRGMGALGFNFGYAPTLSSDNWERLRTSKVFKYIEFLNLSNATATTVWTPNTGRKFRLLGVQVSSSAAATLHLRDGAGGTKFHSYRTGGADTKDFDFRNGYLSSAANNVLEIYNDTGSAVSVWVTCYGTEET